KGLEVIEAYWLFGVPANKIEVVVHPQSVIHSLVEYIDGSVIAQLGSPDMRIPIAHALAYPKRMTSGANFLDLIRQGSLTFTQPDSTRFPCLDLAYRALDAGASAPTVLNAANEEAVAAFLGNRLRFMSISNVIEEALETVAVTQAKNIEDILEIDAMTRRIANRFINQETIH
ncbi:MAG: 1-deoxy-D-xylulose-5-phosphate reductoisomerase, partial [Pseudomonadota bacterium]|nr:1-deoxy-D-xylulose-5-phosphate reductoisomerase [Pseudomonadota bacterium]